MLDQNIFKMMNLNVHFRRQKIILLCSDLKDIKSKKNPHKFYDVACKKNSMIHLIVISMIKK